VAKASTSVATAVAMLDAATQSKATITEAT
jgi:hypothetical protein